MSRFAPLICKSDNAGCTSGWKLDMGASSVVGRNVAGMLGLDLMPESMLSGLRGLLVDVGVYYIMIAVPLLL